LHGEADDDWMVVFEVSQKYSANLVRLTDSLCVDFDEKSFLYKNNKIHAFTTESKTLYVNHQNGALVMTFSESLMRQTINTFVQNSSNTIQAAIDAIPAQRNENAKIHIFVQYQYFIPYLKNKIRKMGGNAAELDLFKACQWSVFELNVKKKNTLLSGYTSIDASNNYAKLLTHNNNRLDMIKFLPQTANHIFSIKARSSSDWKTIKHIVHTDEDFFGLMYPSQILTFDIEQDTSIFHYLLIKSENISEASFHLYNSLRSSFEDNHYLLDTFYIGSLLVGSVDLPNFVFTRLGIGHQLPRLRYYTLIDNYLIFTDKRESIATCIEQLRDNKSLHQSAEYQSSQHYFTREANLFYYCNLLNRNKISKDKQLQLMRMQLYAASDSLAVMSVLLR
jgi:predicted metal-dependent hydrolase